jgi:hypothetical protein
LPKLTKINVCFDHHPNAVSWSTIDVLHAEVIVFCDGTGDDEELLTTAVVQRYESAPYVDSQCLTTIHVETAETNDTPNGDQRQIHGA